MVSPDPEWLLWREQYKIHAKSISDQLSTLTQATSQFEDVSTKLIDLTTKVEQLQNQDDAKQKQIASLEKEVNQQRRLREDLQAENERLRDRILHLVQEANQQDQINAMNMQATSGLQVKIKKLKGDFANVIEALGTMQATTKLERDNQRKEFLDMKAQMEAFLASTAQEYSPSTGRGQKDLAGLFPIESRGDRTMRTLSEATTADESMQYDWEKETQPLDTTHFNDLPGTTQLYTLHADETQPKTIGQTISIKAQGSSSIENYIAYGERAVTEGVKLYEAQAIKKFISGLRDHHAQEVLMERLERVGWTWEKTKEELHRIMREGRRKAKGRRIKQTFL